MGGGGRLFVIEPEATERADVFESNWTEELFDFGGFGSDCVR